MKRLLIGLLIRLLDSSLRLHIDYKQIDKDAVENWAFRSFDDKGWRSYFAYEDMKIFKLPIKYIPKSFQLLLRS